MTGTIRRPGFTVVEILIAVTIIAVAMLPILYFGSVNVEGAKVDRVRLFCEALCRSMLERFGRTEDNVWDYLAPTADPNLREASDLWKQDPDIKKALEKDDLKDVIRLHRVQSKLSMQRDLEPGLHKITSSVSWEIRRGGRIHRESLSYSRFITDGQSL